MPLTFRCLCNPVELSASAAATTFSSISEQNRLDSSAGSQAIEGIKARLSRIKSYLEAQIYIRTGGHPSISMETFIYVLSQAFESVQK